MAKRSDLKSKIKKQDDEVYGESAISGSAPDPGSDDDAEEVLKEAVGVDINQGDEFHLADEVAKDEKQRRSKWKVVDKDDIDE